MMPKDEPEKRYVPPAPLPYFVHCPKPGCRKRYRHHKGLKFHVSAAHRELLDERGEIRDTSEIERMEAEAKERIAKKRRLVGGPEAAEEGATATESSAASSKNSTPGPVVENGENTSGTIVPSLTAAPATANVRLVPKVSGQLPVTAVGQRLVRPASSVQRLIVVSSADGRRMVAVRPVVGNTNNITNTISTAK